MAVVLLFSGNVDGAEPKHAHATFLITGLHCPPCISTIKEHLHDKSRIESLNVSWRSKTVTVQFDESRTTPVRIDSQIARTPHMMGNHMQYAAWLGLVIPQLHDEASANAVKKVLERVKGVRQVAVYQAEHLAAIYFDPIATGDLTTAQLLKLLGDVGFQVQND